MTRLWNIIHPLLLVLGIILFFCLSCASLAALESGVVGSLPMVLISVTVLIALIGAADGIRNPQIRGLQEYQERR